MDKLKPVHGGTDSGPEPRYDFSTNANPFGPCPSIVEAARAADLSRYPDPSYAALRERLAAHHAVDPRRVVVGAGASELILRLVRHFRGSVQILGPTFSEYARCARLEGRRCMEASTPEAFLELQRGRRGLGFVCWPNNPTGDLWEDSFLRAASAGERLVVDFAYAPFCGAELRERAEKAASSAIRLYSPNKSYGVTGLRAAYAILPRVFANLPYLAPTWVLDTPSEAFLAASVSPEALSWLEGTLPKIERLRIALAEALRSRGLEVREGPATFLMVRVGESAAVARGLRERGLRVRDAASFGLNGWLRLSPQTGQAQRLLLKCLDACLESRAEAKRSGGICSRVSMTPVVRKKSRSDEREFVGDGGASNLTIAATKEALLR